MENNSDRMGFALIALSVVAFVLLAVNGPLKSTVNGFFNGFNNWQTQTFDGINESNKQDITHTAYSWSSDGTDRFTTTKPNLNLLDDTTFNNSIPKTQYMWISDGTGDKYLSSVIKNGGMNNKPYVSMSFNSPTVNSCADAIQWEFNKEYFKPSTTYTFSFYLRGNGNIRTHVYPTLIDNSRDNALADGNVIWPWPDGQYDWNLTGEWVRHTYTFTTKSSITENEKFLFRLFTGNSADVCLPKVEEGSVATPYMPSASEVKPSDQPKYIGTYTDKNASASQDPTKYTWKVNPDYHE